MQTVRVPLWLIAVSLSAAAGSLITSSLSTAVSQESPEAKPSDVAVIDVSRVFEKCRPFQTGMADLKKKVESFELVLRAIQKEHADLKQRLEAAEMGSEAQRELQAELATKEANLQVEMKFKRENFLREESDLYAANYDRLGKLVEKYAVSRSIRLVLRYNSESINEKERASVLQGVNRAVVYQDKLDITDDIIKLVNED